MPCPLRSHPHPHPASPDRLPPWEPALSQLRALPGPQLDALMRRWSAVLRLHSFRLLSRTRSLSTYEARLGPAPLSLPVHFRLYQRRNRLQAHHVEAFLGYLVRTGVPAGVLLTTGEVTEEAREIIATCRSPRVRVLSGRQWAAELAASRSGLRRGRFWRWVVDLTAPLKQGNDPFSPQGACRRGAGHG